MRSLSSLICSEVGDTQNQYVAPRSTITTFSGAFETTERPTTNPVPARRAQRGAPTNDQQREYHFSKTFSCRRYDHRRWRIRPRARRPCARFMGQRKDERKPLTIGRKGFSEPRHTTWDGMRNFSYLKRP